MSYTAAIDMGRINIWVAGNEPDRAQPIVYQRARSLARTGIAWLRGTRWLSCPLPGLLQSGGQQIVLRLALFVERNQLPANAQRAAL